MGGVNLCKIVWGGGGWGGGGRGGGGALINPLGGGGGGGLRMQVGTGHPFGTNIALNCNVGTRLGLQEWKCIEIDIY